jgi:hypothetical protein
MKDPQRTVTLSRCAYGDDIWFLSLLCLSDHIHFFDKREKVGRRAEEDAIGGEEFKGL